MVTEFALSFDGDNDYVNCGNDEVFNVGSGDHTIEAWVYLPKQQEKSYGYIASIGNNSAGKQSGVGIRSSSQPFHSAYSSPIVTFNYYVSYGNEYYFAFVHSEGVTILYVNSTNEDNQSIAINTNDGKCYIGDNLAGTGGGSFTGIIAQVRISNKARTQEEITANWNGGKGRPFPLDEHTVGLWYLDEGSGATAYDATENDNDGTIHGATWVTVRASGLSNLITPNGAFRGMNRLVKGVV